MPGRFKQYCRASRQNLLLSEKGGDLNRESRSVLRGVRISGCLANDSMCGNMKLWVEGYARGRRLRNDGIDDSSRAE